MNSQITEYATKIMEISGWNLCDHCLGRIFFKIVEGRDNKDRGEIIRKIMDMESYSSLKTDPCYICSDIFDTVQTDTVDKIINKINEENIEFSSFLVGSRVLPDILSREEEIHKNIESDVESIKKELNREIGKELCFRLKKEVDFENPDIVIMVNFVNDSVDIQINPLFIEGRYRKLIRGIPQTKWPCRKCRGKGCLVCNYTGQMYQESVESLVSSPALDLAKGNDSKFHGAGREDIDVKMLGSGRPFVLEIKEPSIRNLNLKLLQKKINESADGKVEVLDLKFTGRKRKGEIKCSSTETYKTYKAIVRLEEDIKEEKLDLLQSLKVINQRTPVRVAHRRRDKIRTREVRKVSVKWINSRKFEMIIDCEGGLYIKELISGDECRSNPSVSEILGTSALCTQLDVLKVNI